MRHAEALLLIDDQKTKILEFHILGKHTVGTDDNVHLPFFQILNRLFDLPRRAKTRHKLNAHREILHALHKGIVMLLRENGRRHQVYYLLALLHRLKGRAKGNLGLAIAHIPANQAVHDAAALHVALCIFDRRQLVLRLLVREQFFKLLLPYRILAVLVTAQLPPCRIKLHQVPCDFLHGRLDLRLRAVPLLPAQLV